MATSYFAGMSKNPEPIKTTKATQYWTAPMSVPAKGRNMSTISGPMSTAPLMSMATVPASQSLQAQTRPVVAASVPTAQQPVSYLDPSVPNTPIAQVRPVETPTPMQTPTSVQTPVDFSMTETMQERPLWQTEAERYYKGLQAETGRSAEQIRSEELSRVQAQIDAINQIYDQELGRVRNEGAGRLAQTSSIAVSAGLAGSPFQQTQETKTQVFNQRQEQAVQAERAAKIAAIMSGAEDRASERYAKEREIARQGGIDYINFLKETAQSAKQDAVGTIAQLAKGGISLDEIPKERLRQIVQDSGYDEFTLRAVYNTQTNQPTQFSTVGNKLVGYYFDPASQSIKTYESAPIAGLQSGIKYDMKTTPDGTVLMVPETIDPNKPLDDQIKVYGAQGQFSKPTGSVGDGGTSRESMSSKGLNTSKLTEKPLTQAQVNDITGFDTLIRNANTAKLYLDEGLNTGPVASRINQGLQSFGAAPKEFTGYESARSNLESMLMNLRSGAAVTPSEAKRLQNFIPQSYDDEKTAKEKIASFIAETQAAQNNYIRRSQQTLSSVNPPSNEIFTVGSYTVEVE